MALPLVRAALYLMLVASTMPALAGDCIPIDQARQHIGKDKCVIGRVVKVTRIASGTHFLNFCQDYRVCPFQVVVFRRDLKHVGDVRQLEGRTIEIHGDIKDYDGRPEIILKEARQLRGEAAHIPPLPKNYDVEKKGQFSAGRFKRPKTARQPAPKPQGRPIETEEPETE
jgi:rRNA processing protein Gar1